MEIYCTRPGCPRPLNFFADLDDSATLRTAQRKFCTTCGMPLILQERYLPSKLLGRGGFGAAFLARDRFMPKMRQCVVKQFQPSGDLNQAQLEQAQKLFEREAEVLEDLGHQNDQIPDLFAFFPLTVPNWPAGNKQEQLFYLVQQFIDGETLEEELAAKGQFSENEVLEVLGQILPVLKFVHENGSIHRDIKLSNIMRDRKGRLYLLDFGAVKQAAKVVPGGASTGIYTPGYAPLEQMTGGQVFPSTDLYAFAVTCLVLLTGKQPNELFDTFRNSWNWRTEAQCSDRLAAILNRMLLSAPNERFQSALEVLEALTPKASPQLHTQPPPPPPPPAHTQQAHPITPPGTTSGGNVVPPPPKPRFSLVEVLGAAAFTGFEGGLLFIGIGTLVPLAIKAGLVGMILGGLVFAQYRRLIEGKDLPIIAGVTLGIVLFLLRNQIQFVLMVAIVAAAGAIAVTALFRLIYKLLSSFL